jgi:DNA-binding beta-propeller fold protein YncE
MRYNYRIAAWMLMTMILIGTGCNDQQLPGKHDQIHFAVAGSTPGIPIPPPEIMKNSPVDIVFSVDGKLVFVADYNFDEVVIMDALHNYQKVGKIPTNRGPRALAVTPSTLLVVSEVSHSLEIFDIATRQKLLTVDTLGEKPHDVIWTSDFQKIYVANRASNQVVAIDLSYGSDAVGYVVMSVESGPSKFALDESHNLLYVLNDDSEDIAVIATQHERLVGRIPSPERHPAEMALDPEGSRLYILHPSSDLVSVVDVSSSGTYPLIGKLAVSGMPTSIAISDDGAWAYILSRESKKIKILNLDHISMVWDELYLGGAPVQVALSPDQDSIYVVDSLYGGFKVLSVDGTLYSVPLSGDVVMVEDAYDSLSSYMLHNPKDNLKNHQN